MAVLSEIHDRVHTAGRDAGGGVVVGNGMGVLAAYDVLLRGTAQEPTLTIGGCTFEAFDWGN